MADDARVARLEGFMEQLQGFIAQQMVMNARMERRHEEHEATLTHHGQMLTRQDTMIAELRDLNRVQEAHNEALYEMHAELRLAFVNLEARLGRIEALLERGLPGTSNGRGATP